MIDFTDLPTRNKATKKFPSGSFFLFAALHQVHEPTADRIPLLFGAY